MIPVISPNYFMQKASYMQAKLIADTINNMRGDFQELGDAYMFKEALKMIYMRAKTSYHANIAFHRWVKLAEETGIPE